MRLRSEEPTFLFDAGAFETSRSPWSMSYVSNSIYYICNYALMLRMRKQARPLGRGQFSNEITNILYMMRWRPKEI